MFVSPEMGKLLLSGKYVRSLQTPTASFMSVSGQTHSSPCACSLVLNDFEFCHSPTCGAGELRRTANLGGWGTLQRMNGNSQVYVGFGSVLVSYWRFTAELGGCFVYWKKMVSWLFWPIKAVDYGCLVPLPVVWSSAVICFTCWEPFLKYQHFSSSFSCPWTIMEFLPLAVVFSGALLNAAKSKVKLQTDFIGFLKIFF